MPRPNRFPLPLRRLPPMNIPESAYDTKRGQYQSVEIMKMLAQRSPHDAFRVLGITEIDLAIPMLSFLFGQAQFDGPVALVSLCRLRQEFYGLSPQESLLRERVVKEASTRTWTHLRTGPLFRIELRL